MASSGGGAFLPNDPPPSTGQRLTTPTLVSPTITAPVISGAATLASGSTITTPSLSFTAGDLTATGSTGTDALNVGSVFPAAYSVTGTSGMGINLPTGTAGAFAIFRNMTTGVVKVYAVGATMNGVTGTTAISVTATGNKTVWAFATAAGAWFVGGNT